MTRDIRVRFAPSPTGPLHIGGVRTALFNYLFAKKNNGQFILRIEDTDQTRFVEGAEQYIIDSLKWCGISPDEGQSFGGQYGPYKQSERKPIYRQYADQLIAKGDAYYAFDTAEELQVLRQEAEQNKQNFIYNHSSRTQLNNSLNMSSEELDKRLERGDDYVIRYKMPADETIEMDDLIRGRISVNTKELDDKVLFKSDGLPTYHLANIVDDYLMKISHVIRGEEWLPSLPLHYMLYRSLSWDNEQPLFAHLPLILKPKGNGKLSKRDGEKMGFPVFPMAWKTAEGDIYKGYKEDGYFPEAFVNMLALLGWNPGTEQELFSLDELSQVFSLERVGKSGSKFDPEKAVWFNQQYLRQKSDEEITAYFKPILEEKTIDFSHIDLNKVVALLKERLNFVSDLWEQSFFFFQTPETYNDKVVKKRWKEDVPAALQLLSERFAALPSFDLESIQACIAQVLEEKEMGMGKLMNALRLAITGDAIGPDLKAMIVIIGSKATCSRIDQAIAKLQ